MDVKPIVRFAGVLLDPIPEVITLLEDSDEEETTPRIQGELKIQPNGPSNIQEKTSSRNVIFHSKRTFFFPNHIENDLPECNFCKMTGIPSGGHKCDKCGIPVHPFDGGCSVKSPDFCGEGDEEEGSGVRSRRCLRCHAACKCCLVLLPF